MKAKVSKNLQGTLIVSSISKAPLRKKEEHTITVEQFWRPDVQEAIKKKYLTVSGAPKPKETVQIYKTCAGSVVLPLSVKKVLRDDEPYTIPIEVLDDREIRHLISENKIAVVGKGKKVVTVLPPIDVRAKKEDSLPSAVVWDALAQAENEMAEEHKPPKAVKPKHTKQKIAKKDSSILLDTNAKDEEDDGINWVDAEENAKRIAEHPYLSKKKGYGTQNGS